MSAGSNAEWVRNRLARDADLARELVAVARTVETDCAFDLAVAINNAARPVDRALALRMGINPDEAEHTACIANEVRGRIIAESLGLREGAAALQATGRGAILEVA